VLFVSVAIVGVVMLVVTGVERRLGPMAAAWVASLPIAITVAVVAVTVSDGVGAARAMALSAATEMPAQLIFAIVFSTVLIRHGRLLGLLAAAAMYTGCSTLVMQTPAAVAITIGALLLSVAPRMLPSGRSTTLAARRGSTRALSSAAAMAIVGATVLAARVAGPVIAGAIAAFPTLCTILTVVVVGHRGRQAGAEVLLGLVRGIPCYFTFCLTLWVTAGMLGPSAVAVGLIVCLLTARLTWRTVARGSGASTPEIMAS
jgi:uncharacterized membrane protein (GlpM family)